MAQIVDVPGQGEVEFPDSMRDEEIVAAIKKIAAPEQPGMLLRALTWATTPPANAAPEIERMRAIVDKAGPAPINRLLGYDTQNEPDWLSGAKAFVGGAMPGRDPY